MADLSITAANVVASAGATVVNGTSGATITAGQTVYLTAGQYQLAKANAAGTATLAGIALNGASANQPLQVLVSGSVTIGATVTAGQTYVLSAAVAGNIAPITDLSTGNYVSLLGVATSTTVIQVVLNNSATTHA